MNSLKRERRALVRAVVEAPDDLLQRLVLADWLEEKALTPFDVMWAERIRRDILDEPCTLHVSLGAALAVCGVCNKKGNDFTWAKREKNATGTVSNGMVEEVSVPLPFWMRWGRTIVSCQPVKKITTLSGMAPLASVHEGYEILTAHAQSIYRLHVSNKDDRFRLPEILLPKLLSSKRYKGFNQFGNLYYFEIGFALTALKWAALNHARQLAGLPPLPEE